MLLKEGVYLYSVCRRGYCEQADILHKSLCCISCKFNNACAESCHIAIKELPESQETGKRNFCEYAVRIFKKKELENGVVQEKNTNKNPNASCTVGHCAKYKFIHYSRCCWFCREVHSCGQVCKKAKPGRKCEYMSDRKI